MGKKLNLIGMTFNKLTVIEEVPKDKRKSHTNVEWYCRCDCGKTVQVRGTYLKSGHTKSCGCQRAETCTKIFTLDIKNQKFGKLLALENTNKLGSDKTKIWKCKCDCGNIHYTTLNQLKTGSVQSCGCERSRGERKITEILQDNNIIFKKQYTFKDLIDKDRLRFDFAIFNKNNELLCLIEYQGEQHYRDIPRGKWKSPKKHDEQKRQYCKENKIPLFEICYLDFEKIDFSYLQQKTGYLI